MPQIAALFGIAVDPKARPPRPLQVPRGDKGPHKRAGDVNKSADAKPRTDKPGRGPKPQGADTQKPVVAAPAAVDSEPTVVEAEPVAIEVVEAIAVEATTIAANEAPVITDSETSSEPTE
jgi:hypothetical protein